MSTDSFSPADFTYFDLRAHAASVQISTLFPDWRPGDERVVVFSPHDDDGLLGAGYLTLAALANGATVAVAIFCDGRAGYSQPSDRETIVATRRQEATAAYARLGVAPESVYRLELPDFSAWPRIGWHLPGGETGSVARTLPLLRAVRATRVLTPNGYREHVDHEAVARMGAYDAPQAGDPILADWGAPTGIRSLLEYGVWSDFTPEDALVHAAPTALRANRAVVAPARAEAVVAAALGEFRSQQRIIADLLRQRQRRRLSDGRVVEVARWFDPRPPLDYRPYVRAVESIAGG